MRGQTAVAAQTSAVRTKARHRAPGAVKRIVMAVRHRAARQGAPARLRRRRMSASQTTAELVRLGHHAIRRHAADVGSWRPFAFRIVPEFHDIA